jgi:hypothetical protein
MKMWVAYQEQNHWTVYQNLARLLAGSDLQNSANQLKQSDAWDDLIAMAEQEDVLPAIGHNLASESGLLQELPIYLEERCRKALLENVRRNFALTNTAIKISRLLNEVDIEPAWIKGMSGLLTDLYPSSGYRQLVDIDLVVKEEEQQATIRALLAAGYKFSREVVRGDECVLEPATDSTDSAQLVHRYDQHHHFPPLLLSGEGVNVEVHKHPLARRWQKRISLEDFFSHTSSRCIRGANMRIPSPTMAITLAIMSRFASDGMASRYGFPLPQAADAQLLLQSQALEDIDRDYLRYACGHHFPLFMGLLNSLLGCKPWHDYGISAGASRFLRIMQIKSRHPGAARTIEAQGRLRHIGSVLREDPGKVLRRWQK